MASLRGYLLEVLTKYQIEKTKSFKDNQLANFIRQEANNGIPQHFLDRNEYKISASCGQGQWAEIPWMSIFFKDISVSAQKGYDIVYLFCADSQGVYVSLNQGYTFYKERFKGESPKEKIKKVSKYWSAKLNLIKDSNKLGFTTDPIQLHASGKKDLPEGYELGNIYSKYYSLEDLKTIDTSTLLKDLEYLIMVFTELRALLPENYEEFNYRIVHDTSTFDLEKEIAEKNLELDIINPQVGKKVEIPKNLQLNETLTHGKQRRKPNYENELKRNTKQGVLTENIALEIEKNRLEMNPMLKKYSERIIHVSVDEGDGAGYDIQSFDYDAATGDVIEYYIEVKSTTGGIDTPFYLSENELQVAREKGKQYSIYRIFKNAQNKWDYYVLNDPFYNIEYKPIQYLVVPK